MSVAVLIPTFRRNLALTRALGSIAGQSRTPDEIIVADNDPDGGARATVDAMAPASPCPLRYVHVAAPGVSNARNAGFAASDARFIAQLDDDEEADPAWLEALLAMQAQTGAAVVFGPVRAQAEATDPVRSAWMRRLYSRAPNLSDGMTHEAFGCGNSLIDRQAVRLPDPPFDAAANELGGEDDILFARLQEAGARFAWSEQAWVTEHVEGGRAAFSHLFKRSLAYGQGAPQNCMTRRPADFMGAAGWMAVGVLQAVVFGAAAAPARLVSAEASAACLDRAVQGLGKLVWFDWAAPRLYGEASLQR